jgi:hypothetical protein
MVNTKQVTKYVVSYTAEVTIELNENLQVVTHHINYNSQPDDCYLIGDYGCVEVRPGRRFLDLDSYDGDTSGMDDYSAIVGNALSYRNGLTLEFGLGEETDEPF